ncbi:SpdA protein [Streptomyces sp. WAC 06738]|uniref:DUF2637 domain-containing protein n=1 Tax=Streptomyces sp. WAC 06738 TaxID=2203210 RepID=UPI000F6ECF20|nr:DUF2637 domain-containing protein [Streptomyces sp. WAC 06738]AZM47502.1 SpdA protein [Streptomyces sp. WAC 06738]
MRTSIRPDAVLVQAVIAGALSFAHLHDIAEAAGQDGWKAWAYPISVDLLLVAAWRRLRILRDAGAPTAGAWLWFTAALVASLGANVATAGLLDLDQVPAWLRILVAGWPALAFLGGTLLAHTPETGRSAAVPAEPESAPEVVREPAEAPATPPAAELPVAVPDALLAHARKVADAHQARTGEPIDTDTLRARLGVPAPLAAQIATQLA